MTFDKFGLKVAVLDFLLKVMIFLLILDLKWWFYKISHLK